MSLSMERWRGTVAIVTGASSGIGAAIAERLVEEGLQVAGLARRENKVQELADKLADKPGRLYAVKCDVSKEDDILSAFKWIVDNLGPIHVLVNNAGVGLPSSLHDGNTEIWKRILDTNVLGLSVATREAIRNMKKNGIAGHIVHINSINGHYICDMPNHMYYASKYAVTALTEVLRRELVVLGSKIRITSLTPGVVETPIFELAGTTKFLNELKETGSILNPSDIADGIVYVLSTPAHVQIHELTIRAVGENF